MAFCALDAAQSCTAPREAGTTTVTGRAAEGVALPSGAAVPDTADVAAAEAPATGINDMPMQTVLLSILLEAGTWQVTAQHHQQEAGILNGWEQEMYTWCIPPCPEAHAPGCDRLAGTQSEHARRMAPWRVCRAWAHLLRQPDAMATWLVHQELQKSRSSMRHSTHWCKEPAVQTGGPQGQDPARQSALDASLLAAARGGCAPVVRVLLSRGARACTGLHAALRAAATGGHSEVVAVLVQEGCERPDALDSICLRLAAAGGHAGCCAKLVELGACAQGDGHAALVAAGRCGNAGLVEQLLEAGAGRVPTPASDTDPPTHTSSSSSSNSNSSSSHRSGAPDVQGSAQDAEGVQFSWWLRMLDAWEGWHEGYSGAWEHARQHKRVAPEAPWVYGPAAWQALLDASGRGHMAVVAMLRQRTNPPASVCRLALVRAVRGAHADIAHLLLPLSQIMPVKVAPRKTRWLSFSKPSASISMASSFWGHELLLRGVESRSPEVVQLLLQAGLQPDAGTFEAAVNTQNKEVLSLLLSANVAAWTDDAVKQQGQAQPGRDGTRQSREQEEDVQLGSWEDPHQLQLSQQHQHTDSCGPQARLACMVECVSNAARRGWAEGSELLLNALYMLSREHAQSRALLCSWVICAYDSGDIQTLRVFQGGAGLPLWAVADAIARPFPDLARKLVNTAAAAGHGDMLEEILSQLTSAVQPEESMMDDRNSNSSSCSKNGGCSIPHAAALANQLLNEAFMTAASHGHAALAAHLASRGAQAAGIAGGHALVAAVGQGNLGLCRLLLAAGVGGGAADSLSLVIAAGLRATCNTCIAATGDQGVRTSHTCDATSNNGHENGSLQAAAAPAPAGPIIHTPSSGVPYEPVWPVRVCRTCFTCRTERRDMFYPGTTGPLHQAVPEQGYDPSTALHCGHKEHTTEGTATQEGDHTICSGAGCTGGCDAAARMAGVAVVVRLLLEHGASARARTYEALLAAAAHRHSLPVVRLLLEHGGDARAVGSWALHLAAQAGDVAVVQLLLQYGARAGGEAGSAALYSAVASGDVAMIQVLLAHGARVDTPLGAAAIQVAHVAGADDVAYVLAQYGAVSSHLDLPPQADNDEE